MSTQSSDEDDSKVELMSNDDRTNKSDEERKRNLDLSHDRLDASISGRNSQDEYITRDPLSLDYRVTVASDDL